jgi:hypothetical protein
MAGNEKPRPMEKGAGRLDAADLAQLQRMEQSMPEQGGADLSSLETLEELIAWLIADARASGDSEVDAVELLIRYSGTTAPEVRAAERVLRRLGYIAVADMMRRIAGRRQIDLAPLG